MPHVSWREFADSLFVPENGGSERAQTKGVEVILSFLAGPHIVDELAANFAGNDAETVECPVNRPWITRVIVVADPLGYRLAFWSRRTRQGSLRT